MGIIATIRDKLRKKPPAPSDGSEAPPPKPVPPWRKALRALLPIAALLILLGTFVFGSEFASEVEPGEVAVIYNMSGIGLFGEDAEVSKEQGVQFIWPYFQRMEKIDLRPQIFVMDPDRHVIEINAQSAD